jgi:16S rRNA (cytidine1402-2'-O)-methyltransferase
MKEHPPGKKPRGRLFIVATPIGNLEDLTFRALRVLGEVDIIVCEDTRQTKKLLNKYNLKKRLISYFQPKEKQKIPLIMNLLQDRKDIALVSDAGTPGLSDPGYRLIREAIKEEIQLIPIPGTSAVTAALTASGLPTDRFLFIGFPPAKKEKTRKLLQSVKNEASTLVFYIPSRKILFFLEIIQEVMGNRETVIAREMTKIHEEFIRGPVEDLIEELSEKTLKGEATVLIKGSK